MKSEARSEESMPRCIKEREETLRERKRARWESVLDGGTHVKPEVTFTQICRVDWIKRRENTRAGFF